MMKDKRSVIDIIHWWRVYLKLYWLGVEGVGYRIHCRHRWVWEGHGKYRKCPDSL